ncbi:MAG TPA: trypsin-like peptidase domain-containing protein [Gammaproteobacteria bacterium]|nr:trypsin-like peptidase domain-containing protein [Gammaproteobacteria bacterium]
MAGAGINSPSTAGTTAALEVLTGPARGTACWLTGSTLDVSVDDADRMRVAEAGGETLKDTVVARLYRSADGYLIEALAGHPLWINGEQVASGQLAQRDLIEFGDLGPLVRYRLHRQGDRLRRSLGDMLDDAIDYSRASRRPKISRFRIALRDFCRDFVLETTIFFRAGVIVALALLTFFVYQQYRSDLRLQQQASSSARQLESFARSLTRTSEEAIRPADLNRLREELSLSLSDTAQRLQLLEQRSAASKRVIALATRATVFLQGSYGYRDIESGRMLRYRTDADGNPLFSLRGQPLLTLDGDGEVARRVFTGTAFLVSQDGLMLTNRHVALPWEDDGGNGAPENSRVEPVILRFLGYLPEVREALSVEMLVASDETDLALLRLSEIAGEMHYLRLGQHSPEPGTEVIVMGYPTGLRAMLAQTGDRFLAELQADETLDFWGVAERLSESGFIRPLASRGIVGQRSESTLVYDAETTYGGSGGPVLDVNGDVIAINTAIIPEYGGSNFGIPVEFARRLLSAAGVNVQ